MALLRQKSIANSNGMPPKRRLQTKKPKHRINPKSKHNNSIIAIVSHLKLSGIFFFYQKEQHNTFLHTFVAMRFTLLGLTGNAVRIGNSSRCCMPQPRNALGFKALGQIYTMSLMGCTPLGRRFESEVSQKTCHIVNGIAPAANGRFSCSF